MANSSGSVTLKAVTTTGTQTATVQNGGPPDLDETDVRSGFKGYTQGVLIDTEQAVTLGPTTNFVTSLACYTVTMPYYSGTYQLKLQFTHDVGSPAIRTVVTQGGVSNVPCAKNFTFYLYVSPYIYPTLGGCPFYYSSSMSGGMSPEAAILEEAPNGAEGGAPPAQAQGQGGTCPVAFMRGDANTDMVVDISDGIRTLGFLFLGGFPLACKDAADTTDDERLDISDAIYIFTFLFLGTIPPPPPPGLNCGMDPTGLPDPSEDLDCLAMDACNPDDDADGLSNICELVYGTLPNDPDRDDDGFTDGEEVLPAGVAGVSTCRCRKRGDTLCPDEDCSNGVDDDADGLMDAADPECMPWNSPGCAGGQGDNTGLNIAALGADPTRKDIFVEVDWFELAGGRSERPSFAALQTVADVFAMHEITLHIDAGVVGAINFPAGFVPEGNAIVFTDPAEEAGVLAVPPMCPDYCDVFDRLEDFKQQNFSLNRCNVFRYSLWVNLLYREPLGPNTTSGIAQDVGCDDFIVALGHDVWQEMSEVFFPQLPANRTAIEAGTFMHELGHTLNLRHGGGEEENAKPNYQSVMNYRYQVDGVNLDCFADVPLCGFGQEREEICASGVDEDCDGTVDEEPCVQLSQVIEYSSQDLRDLDESHLNEFVGVCEDVAIDWNKNGICETEVAHDINGAPMQFPALPELLILILCGRNSTSGSLGFQVLHGFNDWDHLWFDFRVKPPRELCANQIDDDNDGLVDEVVCCCEMCNNGIDDDGDLLIDMADCDCFAPGDGGAASVSLPEDKLGCLRQEG